MEQLTTSVTMFIDSGGNYYLRIRGTQNAVIAINSAQFWSLKEQGIETEI